jgi:hypothetical protein
MEHEQGARECMNETPTRTEAGTELTQPRSPNVRAQIAALRAAHFDNPAFRHHCNLAIKQIENFESCDAESRPMLAGLIRQTMTELSNLLPGEK